MADYRYGFQGFEKDLMARAVGRDLDISTKQAIEICNFLRRKRLSRAKQIMRNVIDKKEAIPFKRFTNGLGHKPGKIGAGRYPVKAATRILALLESVETNAQSKGLNTNNLEIIHISANMAHRPMRPGRQSRRMFKRSHVEVVVKETAHDKKSGKGKNAKADDIKDARPAKSETVKSPKPEVKSKLEVKPKPEVMSEPEKVKDSGKVDTKSSEVSEAKDESISQAKTESGEAAQ